MHILKTGFNGTPNVGLYAYATDSYVLLGENVTEKLERELGEALGNIPVHSIRIVGTSMAGIFLAGNSKVILAPAIAFGSELENLRKLGVPVQTLQTKHTCLGNLIVANDHGAIISKDFDETEKKRIETQLGVPAIYMDIAGLSTPGAFIVIRGEHGIIHRDASQEEIAAVEKHLQVTLTPATINLGTPYLHAGMIINNHGFVIGEQSGGPEILHIDEALGFLEE